MKQLLTPTLILALVALPLTSRAPEPTPAQEKWELFYLCGRAAFYIGVGALVVLKICAQLKHWGEFPGDMSLPPDPNFPLPEPLGTNPVMASITRITTAADIACIPITATNPPMDTVAIPPTPFTNFWAFTLQAGDTADHLTNLYKFAGWQSAAGSVVQVTDPSDQPVWSDYAARVNGMLTNNLPVWIGEGTEGSRFYRIKTY